MTMGTGIEATPEPFVLPKVIYVRVVRGLLWFIRRSLPMKGEHRFQHRAHARKMDLK